MNYTYLNVFYTVAKLQNISKAAEELGVTQPAVSRIISNIDDDSGAGPRYVERFMLVREQRDGNFCELSSGFKLESETDLNGKSRNFFEFNTPYVTEVKPLLEIIETKDGKPKLSPTDLFNLMIHINTDFSLGEEIF